MFNEDSARLGWPAAIDNCNCYAMRKYTVDWLGHVPLTSRFSLANVNHQLAIEVTLIAYGCNAFSFDNVSEEDHEAACSGGDYHETEH